jgi:hypothetical protein
MLVVGAFLLWPHPDHITRANSDRIREGMSREELYALLGPPGDYRSVRTEDTNPLWFVSYIPTSAEIARTEYDREHVFVVRINLVSGPMERLTWLGNEGDLHVWFRSERVSTSGFVPREKKPQSPLEDLVWRVKRQ